MGRGPQRPTLDDRLVGSLALGEAVTFRAGSPAGGRARAGGRLGAGDAVAVGRAARAGRDRGDRARRSGGRDASGGLGEMVEDGVNGLLFPNGDEAALAERLDAVARGRAFPDHQLPAALVRHLREIYGVAPHIWRLRRIFAETAGLAGATEV